VYGSRWLTAGMGSVLLLWGEAGDLVIELTHLKQPAEDVGPFRILHDHRAGSSTVFHPLDLEVLAATAPVGLTAKAAASAIFASTKASPNEVEKARRRLDSLVAKGTLERHDRDGAAYYRPRRA
jgi:replicative DNA helicase